jgi:hypothetical protein
VERRDEVIPSVTRNAAPAVALSRFRLTFSRESRKKQNAYREDVQAVVKPDMVGKSGG